MYAAEGIGLAAPQIGLSMRLFVIDCEDKETGKTHRIAMTNPEIIHREGEQVGVDGCLSIPGYYGVNVRRAARVVVRGQDMRGKPMRVSAQGLFAWALQHEIDHLDGILFLDRLDRPEDLRELRADDREERYRVSDRIGSVTRRVTLPILSLILYLSCQPWRQGV